MTKHEIPQVISLAHVHAFVERNYSRTHQTWLDLFRADKVSGGKEAKAWPKDLVDLAFEISKGWDSGRGNPAVTPMDKASHAVALDQRKKLVAELTGVTEGFKVKDGDVTIMVQPDHIRQAVVATYPVKDVKASDITHDVVYGFRRSFAIIFANAILIARNEKPVTALPFVVKVFDTEADRRVACVMENTHKTIGVKVLSKGDKVKAARDLLESGVGTQSRFRDIFLAGTGQKLFEIVMLDQAHPSLRLADKVISGQLSFDPLDKEEMRKLRTAGAPKKEVLDYFQNPKGAGGNKSKMATRKEIEALSSHGVLLVRMTAKAILAGDTNALTVLLTKKDPLNASTIKAWGGDLPTIGKAEEAEEEETEEAPEAEETEAEEAEEAETPKKKRQPARRAASAK